MTHPPGQLTPQHAEALDRDLIETLPGGLVHVRIDGAIVSANVEAERILGLRRDEITQRHVVDFETVTVYEDGRPCPAADYPVSRALQTGEAQPALTLGIKHPNGKTMWAVFRATPIKHPTTQAVLGALVSFIDISERKLAQEAAEDHREQLGRAQRIAKVGSWEWDVLTNKVTWSDEMRRIYGNPPEFVGTLESAITRIHPDDLPGLRLRIERAMQGAGHQEMSYRVLLPDGTAVAVWSVADGSFDADGRPLKMTGTVQDVTDQRRLEEYVRTSQRLETVGRLAGGVAHDFNNLLQVIAANVDAGLRYGEPREALRNVGLAVERAGELTQQLLAFGRRSPFKSVPFSVGSVLDELTRLLPPLLGEDISIELDVARTLAPVVGDPGRCLQVLMNLAINARDAMPRGGRLSLGAQVVHADARFRSARPWAVAPRYIEVRVTDSGTGMPPAVLERVFEPFFTTKAEGEGSGLGLAMAYGIMQQHDGMLEAVSTQGSGTTFRMYLPVRERSADSQPVVSRSFAPREPELRGSVGVQRVLLVVEDEAIVRRAIVAGLAQAGFVILEADSGQTALDLFDTHRDKIALVLTDLRMPQMSGRELAERLRARAPRLPILFTTGAAITEALEDAVAGAVVLRKPYETRALLQAIDGLLAPGTPPSAS